MSNLHLLPIHLSWGVIICDSNYKGLLGMWRSSATRNAGLFGGCRSVFRGILAKSVMYKIWQTKTQNQCFSALGREWTLWQGQRQKDWGAIQWFSCTVFYSWQFEKLYPRHWLTVREWPGHGHPSQFLRCFLFISVLFKWRGQQIVRHRWIETVLEIVSRSNWKTKRDTSDMFE